MTAARILAHNLGEAGRRPQPHAAHFQAAGTYRAMQILQLQRSPDSRSNAILRLLIYIVIAAFQGHELGGGGRARATIRSGFPSTPVLNMLA